MGDPLRGTTAEAALMIIAQENGDTFTFIGHGALAAKPQAPPSP